MASKRIVSVGNPIIYLSLEEYLSIEGMDVPTAISGSYPVGYAFDGVSTPGTNGGTPGTVSSNISVFSSKPPLTKRFFIDTYNVWTSQPVNMRINCGGSNNTWIGVVNGQLTLPAKFFVHTVQGVGANIKGRALAGTDNVVVTVCARGTSISADVEFDAPYTCFILADSNTEGTSCEGATSAYDIYTWQMKKFMSQNGIRMRLIDKSQAGRTTTDYENWRLQGEWAMKSQPSMIIYNLGTNDPGRVPDTDYATNLTNAINYKKHRYPNSIMIVIGPLPTNSSTNEPKIAAQRTAAQNIINTANTGLNAATDNNYVYFCNFGDLWTWNVTTYYTTAAIDGNGGIHANLAGQLLMGNRLQSIITTNNIISKLKPVF